MCDCSSSSICTYSCIKFPRTSINIISLPVSFDRTRKPPSKFSLKTSQNQNPSSSKSDQHQFLDELKFKERETKNTQFELNDNDDKETSFLRFEGEEEDSIKIRESEDEVDVKLGELDVHKNNQVKVVRKGKQLMKRSNLIAKQVISTESALSLGFISQLWVDTNTWMVLIVEVRRNLLSGEQEMFFLEDTRQVGDVVLVEDESVMDNEFKMVGLETLTRDSSGYRGANSKEELKQIWSNHEGTDTTPKFIASQFHHHRLELVPKSSVGERILAITVGLGRWSNDGTTQLAAIASNKDLMLKQDGTAMAVL